MIGNTLTRTAAVPDTGKDDKGKVDWSVLNLKDIEPMVVALVQGKENHPDCAWQNMPDAKRRCMAAMMRHIADYQNGDKQDTESGLNHMAHVMCNAMFIMWHDNHENTSN